MIKHCLLFTERKLILDFCDYNNILDSRYSFSFSDQLNFLLGKVFDSNANEICENDKVCVDDIFHVVFLLV